MAWNTGFRKFLVETDSLAVVHLLSKAPNLNHPLYSIIQGCKSFIDADWDCHVQHVFREGNRLTDGLARLGHGIDIGILYFDDPS